jgi:hypothetical protein
MPDFVGKLADISRQTQQINFNQQTHCLPRVRPLSGDNNNSGEQ